MSWLRLKNTKLRRKYNRDGLVEGTWILGMIELISDGIVGGGRYRIVQLTTDMLPR